jgi:hypothetical protein
MKSFPNIMPVNRPVVEAIKLQDSNWLAGFIDAEGCFIVSIFKSKTNIGFGVSLRFTLTQHSRDAQLLASRARSALSELLRRFPRP